MRSPLCAVAHVTRSTSPGPGFLPDGWPARLTTVLAVASVRNVGTTAAPSISGFASSTSWPRSPQSLTVSARAARLSGSTLAPFGVLTVQAMRSRPGAARAARHRYAGKHGGEVFQKEWHAAERPVGQPLGDLPAPVVVEAHDDSVDLGVTLLHPGDGRVQELERRHLAATNERGQPEGVVSFVVGESRHGSAWWPSAGVKSSGRAYRRSGSATRLSSSSAMVPSSTLRRPSWKSERAPSARAQPRSSASLPRSLIRARRSSVIGTSSKMAVRPMTPEPWQAVHPLGR